MTYAIHLTAPAAPTNAEPPSSPELRGAVAHLQSATASYDAVADLARKPAASLPDE